jgi:hypothetical protein
VSCGYNQVILKKGGMSPRYSGLPPTQPPPKPSDAARSATPPWARPQQRSLDDLSCTYCFSIHHDPRRFRLFPFWATGTLGIGHLGCGGGGIWHARSRDRLETKVTRWAKRDALSRGRRHLIIEVVDA